MAPEPFFWHDLAKIRDRCKRSEKTHLPCLLLCELTRSEKTHANARRFREIQTVRKDTFERSRNLPVPRPEKAHATQRLCPESRRRVTRRRQSVRDDLDLAVGCFLRECFHCRTLAPRSCLHLGSLPLFSCKPCIHVHGGRILKYLPHCDGTAVHYRPCSDLKHPFRYQVLRKIQERINGDDPH